MPKLLIMSIYAPSELNSQWYSLQKKFISKNTSSYDFKIISNNVPVDLFEDRHIAIVNDKNIGHPSGINQMLDYMKERTDDYDNFLILDSDAFPVRMGWERILQSQMGRFDKPIAAPIRYENLDIFPHPCIVYMNKEGLHHSGLNFDYHLVKNLLGDEFEEVGGAMVKVANSVLPMLRTNRVNIHPLAAGIYNHLFYHHAAGSRGFDFRLIKDYNFCEHWVDNNNHNKLGDDLLALLICDPDSFIDKLMYGY